MLSSVQALLAEHAELQSQLSEASVHANPVLAKKLNRRYAELNAIVSAYHVVNSMQSDLDAAKDMAKEDESFAAEVPALEEALHEATEKLRRLLIPRDPDDGRDVIMEIKAGEGGAESALFAADLFRMYIQYANSKGWKTEILDKNESDLGGFKDVQIAIKGKSSDPAEGVWAHLKYEVDAPEELEIAANEIRVDVFRSSGPGGQSVNTTDSAVRLTHIPTGIVVSMQNEKSQLQNREAAMRVLRARLLAAQQEALEAELSAARKSQVKSVDRSERIRTYNFPENRIADHRTGYKAYNLDQVMDGALEPVVQSAIQADEEARLAALGENE
ncbi:MAG: hypothetical protein RIT12_63 [Actinomycetota bacterium]